MKRNKKLFLALKAHFVKLGQDLKPMSLPERLEHIWSYYKEYMFVGLMLVILVCVGISSFLNRDTQYYSCGVMSNVELTRQGHSYLTDVFFQDVLGSPQGKIYLTTSQLPLEEYTVSHTSQSYQSYMNVIAQVEGGELDYMLMDAHSFAFYVEDRIYMDLRQLLSRQELDELYAQDRIVHVREENQQEGVPMGIEISQTPFGQDCLTTQTETYLVFIRNTQQPENCLKLWEHIKNWE